MKTEKTLPWLTEDMQKAGATARAFTYLNGLLPPTEAPDLTWREFIFIWSIEGEKFEKTAVFKQRMAPYGKPDIVLDSMMTSIISGIKDAGDLFKKYLPVPVALTFCQRFYECTELWDRANPAHRRLILEKIRDITALEKLKKGDLLRYYVLSEKFPVDRAIATALLNTYIEENTDGYSLSDRITLSDVQIEGICRKLETVAKDLDFDFDLHRESLLSFYNRTKSPRVLQMIMTVMGTAKDINLKWVLDTVKQLIGYEEKGRVEDALFYLPITSFLLQHIQFKEIRNWESDVLRLLPPYDDTNKELRAIVTRVTKYFEENPGELYSGAFEEWYAYAHDPALTEVAIKKIKDADKPDIYFSSITKAYELSKDRRFIELAITKGLPQKDYATEDMGKFLDWLKSKKDSWHREALQIIETNKLLDKWWRGDKEGYYQKNFATIAKYFL